MGIVRTEVAKMSKQRPVFLVVPTTAEQEDLDAARDGEKVLRYLWRHLELRVKLEDVLLWSRVTGTAFWKVCWDGTKGKTFEIAATTDGKPVINAETGAPHKPNELMDENGAMPTGIEKKSVAVGDVHVEVVNCFELFPDPLARTLEECEWVIQVAIKTPNYVKERYGVEMEPDTAAQPGPSEIRIPSNEERGSQAKGIKVYEYWSRPSADNPKGRCVAWAKDKILEQGDNPYGDLPFVMFKSIPVPGRFWGEAIVGPLRGPQTELNKIESQVVENAQRIGNPVILKSRLANTKMSGVPGEIVEFDDTTQNAAPTYLPPPNMPPYVIEQIGRIEKSIQEISGQHEVSNAQVPPGVKAASAINLLQEADDTRLGPGIYAMEESIGEAGTMMLEIISQNWTDERLIMIAGEDHAVDAMHFRGAALKENTQVEVQAGSAFPQSKAAKQAAIEGVLSLALQYQANQPLKPRLISKVIKDYQPGGLDKLFGDLAPDESQINRENQEMAQGTGVGIHPYDNHIVHLESHQEYQKGAGYQDLGEVEKKIFELHVQAHRTQVQKMLQPPQEQEETTESEPPPPPKEQNG